MSNFAIWKFKLPASRAVLSMPKGAKILSVGRQESEIVLWAEVSPGGALEDRVINTFNTGAQLPPDRVAFLGTVQIPAVMGHEMVWHVYEVER